MSSFDSPPDWINDEGKTEWHRLVAELDGELLERDLGSFTLMLAKYGEAEAAAKDVHVRGALVKARTKDHSADDHDPDTGEERPALVKNPSAQIAREAMIQFLSYAKEFGLTPGARKRMQIELKKAKFSGPEPEID